MGYGGGILLLLDNLTSLPPALMWASYRREERECLD